MTSPDPSPAHATAAQVQQEIAAEQRHVDECYTRLAELIDLSEDSLSEVRQSRAGEIPQHQSERDSFATLHEDRLAQLRSVYDRLVFGRLDRADGDISHIGRLGLSRTNQERLVVDWRAPAARPFYQATAVNPGGVARRRHLVLAGTTVTAVEDDIVDAEAVEALGLPAFGGEGALATALNAQRTGRMGDIVATIQAEQDAIVRAPLTGTLVVQGGPGTGKTAVALHRAAYLLYTHRDALAGSGVLVVGPSPVFLKYIERVLPSLGEYGVVMCTPGQLFPGINTTAHDLPEVARLKGDLRMAEVIANAVRAYQKVPAKPLRFKVDGHELTLRGSAIRQAIDNARRSGKPHNLARHTFVKTLLQNLASQLVRAMGVSLDPAERGDLIADLRSHDHIRVELNRLWLPVTPEQLISRLLALPERLTASAPHLSSREVWVLSRDLDEPWTVNDIPLLDEAAELLGHDDAADRHKAQMTAAAMQEELSFAQDVLQMTGMGGRVDAERLAARFTDSGPRLTLAEQAGDDRSWVYGHVIVDEAQELSPMAWRVLARRCPSRSMTVVGDLAQASSADSARSWGQVLGESVGTTFNLETLSVSYRTPAQVMAVAKDLLTHYGWGDRVPNAVREGTWAPVVQRSDKPVAADLVAQAVEEELDLVAGGTVAVVAPRGWVDSEAETLVQALGAHRAAVANGGLEVPVSVLTANQVKGLEFDSVLVVEPGEILGPQQHGLGDLYVALTRPTQRLRVLVHKDLPPGFPQGSKIG